MKVTAFVDVEPVRSYMDQLAIVLKQSNARTIRMEAMAIVLSAMTIGKTKKFSDDEIEESARRRALRRFPTGAINSGKRGGVRGRAFAVINAKARRLYDMEENGYPAPIDSVGKGAHLTDAEWATWKSEYVAACERAKKSAVDRKAARFLTAKSWFELMVKIAEGGDVKGYRDAIKRARPVGGKSRDVVAAVPMKTGTLFSLTVVNSSGIVIANNGQRYLNTAIARRRKFFLNSLEKGFLSDAKFLQKYYPWAVVS